MAGRWFSPGTPMSFTNITDRHDITEILLKVVLNTITHHPSLLDGGIESEEVVTSALTYARWNHSKGQLKLKTTGLVSQN